MLSRSTSIVSDSSDNCLICFDGCRHPTMPIESSSKKEYFCFLVMIASVISTVGFYQGIADKAIGKSNNYSLTIILFSQYGIEIIVNFFTAYWTKWLSHSQRIALCSCLFLIGFIVTAFVYNTSSQLTDDSIWHASRLCIIGCVMLNAIAALIGEISLMQYVAFYDQKCINAISTGGGFGAVIGAALALLIEIDSLPKFVLFGLCALLPINLLIFYFYFLPHPILSNEIKHKSVINDNEQNEESEVQISAFAAFKKIIIGYWQYSIPLMSTYFLFEFMRCTFIKRVWPSSAQKTKTFYKIFNFFFRGGSFVGKSSTNFIQTTKYWIFPLIICIISAFIAIIYTLQRINGFENCSFVEYFVKNQSGHWMTYIVLAIPLGVSYGSTSSNIYYTMRRRIQNVSEREFALGNIRQTISYAQIMGTILSMPFKNK